MRNWMGGGGYRICPLCEATNKAGRSTCEKCRTPLGSAPVVAARAQAHPTAARNPIGRLLVIGGLLAAIGAGLAVRGILNAGLDDPVIAEDEVRAAGVESAGPALPPPEVSSWTPGSAPATASLDAAAAAPPPAWSSSSFPVARIEPPSDPSMAPGVVALMRRLDLAPLCREVKEKVARLAKRPANRRGRNRGLVQSTGR